MNLADVYREEVKLLKAGQVVEEDAAMTETLGRRIKKVDASMLQLADFGVEFLRFCFRHLAGLKGRDRSAFSRLEDLLEPAMISCFHWLIWLG